MAYVGHQHECYVFVLHAVAHIVGAVVGYAKSRDGEVSYVEWYTFFYVMGLLGCYFPTQAPVSLHAGVLLCGGVYVYVEIVAQASRRLGVVIVVVRYEYAVDGRRVDVIVAKPFF